jgi:hypothetical protein
MHKIPLFLEIEDKFLFGITMRQCLLLFVGAGISYVLFLNIFDMISDPTIALAIGLVVALLFFFSIVAIAFIQLRGRGLEEWGLVVLVYVSQPKIYTWHFNVPDLAFQEHAFYKEQEQESSW